ncbi:ferredoxin [Pseudonocardia sp. N23]|uniref:ferredoxin n=1 Tax=Pseudonocardia sp. N23 TaxID=1987376 RepID=UPI000BFE8BF9|nr:ferredoxin [Pseudonocardia sp. N23]GAY08351.1 putative Fe-S, FMN containing oxidoreductase [Pseudonocardia sp. N23]
MSGHRTRSEFVLRVDPIACAGHGLCAHLLPEHIALDEWGYPVMAGQRETGPLEPALAGLGRQAVEACPTLALRLRRTVIEVRD